MSNFKVGLGINYWDDIKGLFKILNSDIYDYVDKIYVIDGRYKDREDSPVEEEYALDILCKTFRKIQLTRFYNAKQIEKRNRYWERAEEDGMDFLIVIDSDETIEVQPTIFEDSLRNIVDKKEQCFPISQEVIGISTFSRPRLFKAPFNFRHRQNRGQNGISHGSLYKEYGTSQDEIILHFYAWFKYNPSADIHNGDGLPGIKMWHDKSHRTRERIIADRVFYNDNPDR